MITALRIQNLAIVESVEVAFGPGFNVVTGETGAGKSLLVDALHLILGGRARLDLVRTGADEASVEALFEGMNLDAELEELGLPSDGDALLIRRTVSRTGRGRIWINGALSTARQLEKLAHGLVDISGQHEHVSLLKPELHLGLIDAFAGDGDLLSRYRTAHAAFIDSLKQREALVLDDAERAQKLDYLRFQIDEIEAVDPKDGEIEALEAERRALSSVERQKRALSGVESLLYSSEDSVLDRLSSALNALGAIGNVTPEAEAWIASLQSARIEIDELAREISRHARDLRQSPERLEEVADRLEALKRLCRKHGGTLEAVLQKRAQMRAEIDGLDRQEERVAELDEACQRLGREALELAGELSKARQEAAARFARAVEGELKKLAMDKTVFEVALTPHAGGPGTVDIDGQRVDSRGLESAEFLISPNRGEAIKSLSRIASGGELSRLMLAIKRVLARVDPVFTYVFDEVDTGMSGAAADAVGRVLKAVSLERQIIVVTHLPQIAAFADSHFTVAKQSRDERVRTCISLLSNEGRIGEIARMLAGSAVTPEALGNARAMIEACGRVALAVSESPEKASAKDASATVEAPSTAASPDKPPASRKARAAKSSPRPAK